MDHVNNAVYADWLDEAVLAAGGTRRVRAVPRLVRLEYARAAEPAAHLSPTRGRTATRGSAGSPTPTARTCCGLASSPTRRMTGRGPRGRNA